MSRTSQPCPESFLATDLGLEGLVIDEARIVSIIIVVRRRLVVDDGAR